MRAHYAIVAFPLIVSQFSLACGGFSPSGQTAPSAGSGQAKPTEAAKPAEAARPAAPASPAPAAAPAAAAPAAKGSGEVVVNGYAAEYEDLFNKLIKAPFEQETGIKVVFDSTGSAAEDYAKIRASGGDPGWDVDVVTAQEAIQGAKENLLLEITEANVPSIKLLYPDMRKLVGPYGVPHEIQYM